jgi:phage terminase large subunit-like protein
LPAICEDNQNEYDPRKAGEALWPAMYPLEVLRDKQKSDVRKFSAMYQQDPIAASGNTFKKEDFRYFNLSDLKKEDFTVAIHCDPAFSTSKSSDDVGIVVTARHKTTKEIYVLDVFGEPLAPSESYSYLLSLAERWKDWTLEFISIEEATISREQQDFLNGFEKYLRDNGKFYTVLLFKPRGKGKKEDRIKFSLEPVFNRHAIYFRGDQKTEKQWIKLEEQLLKFPFSIKDDILDATSQGIFMWGDRSSIGESEEAIPVWDSAEVV